MCGGAFCPPAVCRAGEVALRALPCGCVLECFRSCVGARPSSRGCSLGGCACIGKPGWASQFVATLVVGCAGDDVCSRFWQTRWNEGTSSARVLCANGVDVRGGNVRMIWKCRRPADDEPWRWELRRLLDSQFSHNACLKYNKVIARYLPEWMVLLRDVGVATERSYWPSRRSVVGMQVDLSMVDEEYSVDTFALAPMGVGGSGL